MSNFDLSMSNFLVPGLRNYQPKVGKMKSPGVSLTTLEVVNNMATPYTRVFTMTDGDTVSGPVEADCTVIYRTTASQQLDLISLKGSPGVKINFILEGTGSLELVLSSGVQPTTCTLTPQASIALVYPLNSGGVQTGWVVGDASITASIGTLSSLTTSAKNNLVAAVNEVQSEVNTASSTYRYTFVVDSNAALTAWANNDRSGGKDYTSVLIRRGEWTSTKGVNLTTAGTKVVVGEPGSKLVFNNVGRGLYYDTVPTKSEYYMTGVTVTVDSGSGSGSGFGFYSCTNLTNCSVSGSCSCSGSAFHSCTNIARTSGRGASSGSGSGFGFNACTNITNCSGSGANSGSGLGFGFFLCKTVICCKAGGHCKSAVFSDCYSTTQTSSTYACADTPNGGFNNTTNPPA